MTEEIQEVNHHEESPYSFGESFIALLSSLFMAATAWATVLGLIWAINYGLEYFGVAVSLDVRNIIKIVNNFLPGIVGVIVGFINYSKVLELEG